MSDYESDKSDDIVGKLHDLYNEFLEANEWNDMGALENICKKLHKNSERYSTKHSFLNHNWDMDNKGVEYEQVEQYGVMLGNASDLFSSFPWRKTDIKVFELMMQCDFFNPLWTTEYCANFLIHEKIGFTQIFVQNKLTWLSRFKNDFSNNLFQVIWDGNDRIPRLVIDTCFQKYSTLDLEGVLPYAIKQKDMDLVHRCLRLVNTINLDDINREEDFVIAAAWLASCGKPIVPAKKKLVMRCKKRLVLNDMHQLSIGIISLDLPVLLQLRLLELLLEPFSNCTPYFWISQAIEATVTVNRSICINK